jgi:molecular chaperone Hsp33
VTACTTRNLLNDFMIMHTMTATPADALGRTLICALLMSNGMQAEQTCQITINSDGPLRGVVAISDGRGKVRGYVGSPMLGESQLTEAVGQGLVQVVKNHPDWPNPYNGITQIRYRDIDRDIGVYLAESEQRSCALAAATSINGILCTAAGGYLIEQLPDASPETLKQVEKNLAVLVEKDGGDTLPTNLLLNGVTPLEIAETILDGLGMRPLQQIEPQFECKCSSQRLVRALRLLPRSEVDEILASQEKIEARCEFCGKQYEMGPEEIREELDNASGDPALDSDFKET